MTFPLRVKRQIATGASHYDQNRIGPCPDDSLQAVLRTVIDTATFVFTSELKEGQRSALAEYLGHQSLWKPMKLPRAGRFLKGRLASRPAHGVGCASSILTNAQTSSDLTPAHNMFAGPFLNRRLTNQSR